MAKKLYEESNIYDIACALREKCGDDSATYKTCDMADAIRNLSTSGGTTEGIPLPFELTGDGYYRFAGVGWNDFIKTYPITTDLTNCHYMFYRNTDIEEIPFDINITGTSLAGMFNECSQLKSVSKINASSAIKSFYSMFYDCYNLRELPEDFATWFTINIDTDNSSAFSRMFYNCYSLRSVPVEIFANDYISASTPSSSYLTSSTMTALYAVDELVDLPLPHTTAWVSSNTQYLLGGVDKHRLKRFTFTTNNGTPLIKQWANVFIQCSGYVGYARTADRILNYNSGCTEDTRVTDAATYNAIKDHSDYWTTDIAYSRYNHDSAVETINSLPDTSAYLSTTSYTNTISFDGTAGSATDGGAINTLTETEIAVATAKGWTIAFV